MAKELPYFRFTVQEWQNGDITLEDYSLQGLFINICGFYWIKDCSIDLAMLEKKFRNDKAMINQLIESDIIKLNDNDEISIKFLDEQFDLLSESRLKRQLAGKKGGKAKSSNAKAMLKQSSSYKDKDKDKDNNNKKAFGADVNRDKNGFINYFKEVIKSREVSVERVLMESKLPDLEQSTKDKIWESFIENAKINTPLIEDEKHAFNTWKKYMLSGQWKEKLNTNKKLDYYSPSKIKENQWQ